MNFLFERFAYWYGRAIYNYLRFLSIFIGILCFIIGNSLMELPVTAPNTLFFYMICFFFAYNFLIGRFVFFMFFRPQIVNDPEFGWYRVYLIDQAPFLYVERQFEIPERQSKEKIRTVLKKGDTNVELYGVGEHSNVLTPASRKPPKKPHRNMKASEFVTSYRRKKKKVPTAWPLV
eukprot:TRINITY_DN1368_c0_g1_i1.p1 TRINITY_DN1368_c0_g1~~TRINITY_DN1368_c0_g1_i1.p1  ORF type:complete len:176 (+),score=15.23 TRINITY_DN1368_c0_g1_i1:242-769(+)